MTVTVNTVWYANYGNGSSTGYYALPLWALNTAYTVGNLIRQKTTPAVGSERCFICITAGTSSNTTEPTWVLTKGAKSTDAGGPVYMECSGRPALNADLTNTPLSSQNRSGAQSLGNLITNNTQDHYFICTTAGTTGAGEPTYTTTTGGTTVDSGCTWTCLGAVGSFTTKWGAPWPRLGTFTLNSWNAFGDTIWVSSAHAELAPSGVATIGNGAAGNGAITKMICVGNAGNIPPQSADITTGASFNGNGAFAVVQINNAFYFEGITFIGSNTSVNINCTISNSDYQRYVNCQFNLTNATQFISASEGGRCIWENCTVAFNGASLQTGLQVSGNFYWRNTASALSKNGSNWPSSIFAGASQAGGAVLIENVDFSAFAGTAFFGPSEGAARWVFNKCKLPSVTVLPASFTDLHAGMCADFIDCDTGGNTYNHQRWAYEGSHVVSTTAVYTGGASNGTTAYSWQLVTSANPEWVAPFECLPMAIWNSTVAANRTVTVQGIYNGASLPNNDQIWMDVYYFGTAASTLGTGNSETKATYLASGTPLTANTSAAWNSAATARANTHAYSLGDLISVGTSAAGQLYICTTAGTSSGSPPVGYASCSDGSTVNDGTAVFRAMMRFLMTVTLSTPQPQSAGYFNVYVKAALASATFFVDPSVTLT